MEEQQSFDNSDQTQPNGINMPGSETPSMDIINNCLSSNLAEDITQQLHDFETILNNRRSELPFNENDTNLDEINEIVSQHLYNNVELTQIDVMTVENMDSNPDLLSISINTISSTVDEELDIISISSTDSQISCSGYHSSDFEFITETEARADGLIINFKGSDIKTDFQDPGEGTSGLNKKVNAVPRLGRNAPSKVLNEYIERSSNILRYRNRPLFNYSDRSYRRNHEMPDAGNYLNLFQGINDPILQQIRFLENKSIRTSVMNVEYDGLGFDEQLVGQLRVPDSSDDEFEDEAKENAKRIHSMYPHENNKRRRRR